MGTCVDCKNSAMEGTYSKERKCKRANKQTG